MNSLHSKCLSQVEASGILFGLYTTLAYYSLHILDSVLRKLKKQLFHLYFGRSKTVPKLKLFIIQERHNGKLHFFHHYHFNYNRIMLLLVWTIFPKCTFINLIEIQLKYETKLIETDWSPMNVWPHRCHLFNPISITDPVGPFKIEYSNNII